jgi:hypothetical protein
MPTDHEPTHVPSDDPALDAVLSDWWKRGKAASRVGPAPEPVRAPVAHVPIEDDRGDEFPWWLVRAVALVVLGGLLFGAIGWVVEWAVKA